MNEEWDALPAELRAAFLLRERELELLHEIDLRILADQRPLDETFSFIVAETQELINSEHTHILLRRGQNLESVYTSAGTDLGQLLAIDSSITGECFATNNVIRIPDLADSDYRHKYVPIRGQEYREIRSLLACPIRLGDVVIGVLNAESSTPGAFENIHERVCTAIAAQIAIAVQRTHTFDQAALFSEVDTLLFNEPGTSAQDVVELALNKVVNALRRLKYINLEGAQVLFPHRDGDLEIKYSTNSTEVGISVAMNRSVCGRAARERRTVIVGDVRTDDEYRTLSPKIRSEIAVPIMLGDQVLIGVLNVESEQLDAFGGFYELLLTSFADKVKTLLAFTKLHNDVTEALELRQANEVMLAVADQTTHLVHRVNTKLGIVRVNLHQLASEVGSGRVTDVQELGARLTGLLAMVNDTLQIPRQVTRVLDGESRTKTINDYVLGALDAMDIASNIDVVLKLDRKLPALPLYCFDIVVQNIVQNAVDAMPDGGRLLVETRFTSLEGFLGGYVQLIVTDTGIGIPGEDSSRVFELNYTTKNGHGAAAGKVGSGLGLGLWWVRNFVRRAHGEIWFDSQVGRGTSVTVKIPERRETAPRALPVADLGEIR